VFTPGFRLFFGFAGAAAAAAVVYGVASGSAGGTEYFAVLNVEAWVGVLSLGYKGGIGKTTTAVHLAAFLHRHAGSTVLVDGDINRSATAWERNGSLPFPVVDERQAAKVSRDFEHIVIDTAARPVREDLQALVAGCDHLIIPSTPDALALDALVQTVGALKLLGAVNYRVLLTIVPPAPSRDAAEARASLAGQSVPVFETAIPRLAAFTKAALAGVVVSDVSGDPRAERAWDAYARVGKELMQ